MDKSICLKIAALTACFVFAAFFCAAAQARIEIRTLDDLDNIRNDLSGSYILMNDIDASATRDWDGGAGWEPVGDREARFRGVLDGNGYAVLNLHIDRPGRRFAGLFGWQTGRIENLGIQNGVVKGRTAVGGFAGVNEGLIAGSYFTGEINGRATFTGGLAGANAGEIRNSCAKVDLWGDESAGGLAGRNEGLISGSFSAGSVRGRTLVGGLAGGNRVEPGGSPAVIEDSYTTASVSAALRAGGLVPNNLGGAVISNCYSAGSVEARDRNYEPGGLVYFNAGSVSNSFWDMQSSGAETSGAGEGKTTAEMASKATFGGWDFDNVWNIQEGEGYPFLRWQMEFVRLPFPDIPRLPGPIPELPEPRFPDLRPRPPENLRAAPGDGRVTLTWDESPSSGIESYRVYVRVPESLFRLQASVPADTTEYVDEGLTNNVTYIYTVRSFSNLGFESAEASNTAWAVPGTDESEEDASPSPDEMPPPEGEVPDEEEEAEDEDDSSGCFIATAAYGSCMSSEVVSLRTFRDGFLLGSGAGDCLVRVYYAASPELAEVVEGSIVLRKIARLHLAPFVKAAGWMFN